MYLSYLFFFSWLVKLKLCQLYLFKKAALFLLIFSIGFLFYLFLLWYLSPYFCKIWTLLYFFNSWKSNVRLFIDLYFSWVLEIFYFGGWFHIPWIFMMLVSLIFCLHIWGKRHLQFWQISFGRQSPSTVSLSKILRGLSGAVCTRRVLLESSSRQPWWLSQEVTGLVLGFLGSSLAPDITRGRVWSLESLGHFLLLNLQWRAWDLGLCGQAWILSPK